MNKCVDGISPLESLKYSLHCNHVREELKSAWENPTHHLRKTAQRERGKVERNNKESGGKKEKSDLVTTRINRMYSCYNYLNLVLFESCF